MVAIRGGTKFESEMAKLAARIARPRTLRVGFLENATYPDGKLVAMIAAIQNYGAPRAGIPPRPFFTNMVKDRADGWPKGIAASLKRGDDVDTALGLTGSVIRGQLQLSIRDTNSPPLSPVTVARKGFAKPLIHTSHMLNSVNYEIT